MAFREKSAWISLVLTLAAYGAYFAFCLHGLTLGRPFAMTGALTLTVLVLVVLQVAGMIVISIQSPRDAQAPEDERERLIQLRAKAAAYMTLQFGAVAAAASVYYGQWLEGHAAQGPAVSGWLTANAVLAALAAAQVAQHLGVIVGYRRGV